MKKQAILLNIHSVIGLQLAFGLIVHSPQAVAVDPPVAKANASSQTRTVTKDSEIQLWLTNMLTWHQFTFDEAGLVLGLSADQVKTQANRLGVSQAIPDQRKPGQPLVLLPYPGGRHPRIGFLEGAVDPQRETKISAFTPWDSSSYVVVDLPEAIFSNLGLTYLAHTHIPTIFDLSKQPLQVQEWVPGKDGSLALTRVLPNGISYTAKAFATESEIRMELLLTNGTKEKLTGLKVQQCAMLKATKGFEAQTNSNKRFESPYAIAGNSEGTRWIVHAWFRSVRAWGNAPCPCLHSDPQFADLKPGETGKLVGRLWFYEGKAIDTFLDELKKLGWDR
ncbi:MAG: hypothetical protein DWI24_07410 [Planctomycetota bacterium]|nr:MAG: hypothetical protein DWI24_07410 [Planctomycetota bacterium]